MFYFSLGKKKTLILASLALKTHSGTTSECTSSINVYPMQQGEEKAEMAWGQSAIKHQAISVAAHPKQQYMEAHIRTRDVKGDWCSLFKPVTQVCACLSIHEEILGQCSEASDIGCQGQWQHRDLLVKVEGTIIKPTSEGVLSILTRRRYNYTMCLIPQCNEFTFN